jgi:transposase
MTSVAASDRPGKIVVGVDTHKHVHVAVAIDELGARLGHTSIPVDTGGYR